MTQDNLSIQLDNQSYQIKSQFISIYFQNKLKKLSESDFQNKKLKYNRNIFAKKDYNNTET